MDLVHSVLAALSQFSFYSFFAYTQDTKTTADDIHHGVVLQGHIADGQEPAPVGQVIPNYLEATPAGTSDTISEPSGDWFNCLFNCFL